ncbi:putative Upstream activation factor subunit UAF30 [Tripterygium wilfordii]|uniref:Putative Upstream activation factor subunit UAF30 n=1 Tax=Tripterygium wilfordii TaxID=458696 RepID=A0A7J7E2N2_TRIWF|nr:upstream activation factor subunit spp27-like [Tripterygium wilfordii]KAF5752922.1 putative Upstream activation factor subunit UAF30 [Tripterygium wilfordii]
MVSDSELIDRLREFLRNSDLNTTTNAIVRRKLEEDFGIDLSDKKAFIREQVDLFLQNELENAEEENEESGNDGDDDNKKEKVKSEETGGPESMEEVIDDEEKDEGDEEEADEAGEEESSDGKPARKRRSGKLNNEPKKRGGGFCKLCSLSPQLQEFLGVPEMARTEVVKQLWNHIKEKSLQDPSNRQNILCDEPLQALFRVDSINMFQMNKALSKHIWPLGSDTVIPVKSIQKEEQQKHEKEEDPDEPKKKEKRQKGEKSGFLAPLQLSDALITFLGTGESELSRTDVVKRMWEYIKENNLQDPSDKRRIICDEKLKDLFDVESFVGFTVTKLLAAHFSKT